jgi:hypothetical protein
MPVRFNETLSVTDGSVAATGPLDDDEKVLELCAWVFQGKDPDDAAATEMTTNDPKPVFKGNPPEWSLRLGQVPDSKKLKGGPAFAVAVALIEKTEDKETEEEKKKKDVVWWGHPITLVEEPPEAPAEGV